MNNYYALIPIKILSGRKVLFEKPLLIGTVCVSLIGCLIKCKFSATLPAPLCGFLPKRPKCVS